MLGVKPRVVVALRERGGRTVPFVGKSEAQGAGHVLRIVDCEAALFADEGSHWDVLEAVFVCGRTNQSEEYSAGHGKHASWVERYFSCLRLMVAGQHHWVSGKYLGQYASHAAWIEDHRRDGNGMLAERALRNALFAPVSRAFKGYWQRAA